MRRGIAVIARHGFGALAGFFILAFGAQTASAVVIDISTGVRPNGDLIDFGDLDTAWEIVDAPAGLPLGDATVVPRSRGFFVDLEPDARWTSVNEATNEDAPGGLYSYQTRFAVGSTQGVFITIDGEWAADNRLVEVLLNGSNIFNSSCGLPDCAEYGSAIPFFYDGQDFYQPGQNLLTFVIENQMPGQATNPSSFVFSGAVEFRAIPEPVSLTLVSLGLLGIGFARRRLT